MLGEEVAQIVVQPLDVVLAIARSFRADVSPHLAASRKLRGKNRTEYCTALTSSPVSPDRREDFQLADAGSHVLDFDFGVLGGWFSLLLILSAECHASMAKKTLEVRDSRKYKSVFEGNTNTLALMPFIAASKSPLYGSCCETSPDCHVYSIASMFSGSVARVRKWIPRVSQAALTFGKRPGLPPVLHKVLQALESKHILVQLFAVEGLREAPAGVDSAAG